MRNGFLNTPHDIDATFQANLLPFDDDDDDDG